MSGIDRRSFLAGAGALGVLPAVRAVSSPRVAAEPPFAWGVASFDPTESAVLIWTRLVPSPTPQQVSWVVARDVDLVEVVAEGTAEASADTDHCVIVDAADLPAGLTWWYAFTTPDGARSPVGRTRTMPRATERVRLGVASCSRYATGGFGAYRALADREVDLVVHLGDYIYEDGESGARTHEPARELRSVSDYRARYAQHRADPDLQALHARHPMVAVWDDHDVAGNAWRDGAPGHDPSADGNWVERVRAASQAHEEWLPGRTTRAEDGRLRAWRSLRLGSLAELVVLDTRIWGRDQQPTTPAELGEAAPADRPGSGRSMLGSDQEQFVAERLRRPADPARRTPWLLLANQVMFHPLRVPVPSDALVDQVEDAGLLVVGDEALNPDQWDGYPHARDSLVAAIGDAGGVVMLTGDLHSSWAWEGPARGDAGPSMVELVTPSISSAPFAQRIPLPAALVESALVGLSDDLSLVELSSHGYLLIDLDEVRMQAEWWFVDPGDASTARLGAARTAPPTVPMQLTETETPTDDPATTTTTAPPPSPTTTAVPDAGADGLPVAAIGAGAAAVVSAVGAAVALRRRRSGP